MPRARRLRDRQRQDHARPSAARAARHPRGRAGMAGRWLGTSKRCSPPVIAAPSISLARMHCVSVAFPAISTGVYGFPADLAARIAVGTVASEIGQRPARYDARCVLLFFGRQRGVSQGGVRGAGVGVTALLLVLAKAVNQGRQALDSRFRGNERTMCLRRGQHQTFGSTSSRTTQPSNPGIAAG